MQNTFINFKLIFYLFIIISPMFTVKNTGLNNKISGESRPLTASKLKKQIDKNQRSTANISQLKPRFNNKQKLMGNQKVNDVHLNTRSKYEIDSSLHQYQLGIGNGKDDLVNFILDVVTNNKVTDLYGQSLNYNNLIAFLKLSAFLTNNIKNNQQLNSYIKNAVESYINFVFHIKTISKNTQRITTVYYYSDPTLHQAVIDSLVALESFLGNLINQGMEGEYAEQFKSITELTSAMVRILANYNRVEENGSYVRERIFGRYEGSTKQLKGRSGPTAKSVYTRQNFSNIRVEVQNRLNGEFKVFISSLSEIHGSSFIKAIRDFYSNLNTYIKNKYSSNTVLTDMNSLLIAIIDFVNTAQKKTENSQTKYVEWLEFDGDKFVVLNGNLVTAIQNLSKINVTNKLKESCDELKRVLNNLTHNNTGKKIEVLTDLTYSSFDPVSTTQVNSVYQPNITTYRLGKLAPGSQVLAKAIKFIEKNNKYLAKNSDDLKSKQNLTNFKNLILSLYVNGTYKAGNLNSSWPAVYSYRLEEYNKTIAFVDMLIAELESQNHPFKNRDKFASKLKALNDFKKTLVSLQIGRAHV